MKKFLLSLVFAAALGSMNQAEAQCNGASVLVTNINITNVGLTYNYSYNWRYINGNASIQVVLKCGGVVVAEGPCNENLRGQSGGDVTTTFYHSNSVSYPVTCTGLKEIEFRVYASTNCNGNFCILQQPIPLPVKFASFTATRNRSNVNVAWTTASEQNNSGFAVERNVNGSWEQIGWIPTQAQNGNSDISLNYSFVDMNNVKGITQYRIRQVDIDTKSSFSVIRSVRGEGQMGKTIVYPNPSNNGRVSVVFEDAAVTREISISDMSGRLVRQIRGISNNNLTIDNLNPGMYTIRIVAIETGEQTVEKIVVNKR